MDKIVIEVDSATASKWFTASARLRQEIGKYMNDQISAIIDKKENTDIIQYLKELRREMKQKGLTQVILDDILKDE
jgi:Mg/Co/Ni transporter MgtE